MLIIMLFCFTFITMVGGNPAHDAYGFRYWKEPVGTFLLAIKSVFVVQVEMMSCHSRLLAKLGVAAWPMLVFRSSDSQGNIASTLFPLIRS